MSNLSKIRRDKMIEFLETLKEQHSDDESLIAINQIEKELVSKRYGLVWEEHEEAVDVMMRDNIPVFTEVKEREICMAPDEDYNFLLEGDNLHSLHLLEKTHRGKVDVIYIDPPYNTKNKDFIYDDAYVDKTDAYRNSKWLSFMQKRLIIAHKLLKKTGVIFISIDDYEYSALKILCDEIFGSENFVATFVWKITGHTDNQDIIIKNHEYIVCYSYAKTELVINNIVDPNILENSKIMRDFAENSITKNGYKNPPSFITLPAGFPCEVETLKRSKFETFPEFYDEVERTKFISREITKKYSAVYPIPVDDMVVEDYKLKELCRVYSGWMNNGKLKRFIENEFNPIDDNGTSVRFYLSKNGVLYYRRENRVSRYIQTVLENMGTTETNKYLLEGMGLTFDYPKPLELISYLINIFAPSDGIIIDFFAGSGTTAHAILEQSKVRNRKYKFILCTNNENNICEEITYQRIKTVITGKRQDGSEYSEGIPANLKYYHTDFVSKSEEYLEDSLLNHVTEMVQLEHGVRIDDDSYIMIMSDDEADELEKKWNEYTDIKAIYVSQDVLLTASQEALFGSVDTYIIPDYYFNFELREAGELW